MKKDDLLKLVDPKRHKEFLEYIKKGEATEEFLEYIEQNAKCKRAADIAFDDQVAAFERLFKSLRDKNR